VLVGLNADSWPRPARPDPFLSDADRSALRNRIRRPVPLKEERLQEERLILALTLGSARRRLVVAWQRADDDGRARPPSLALREVARAARGSADLERVRRAARRISADPAERAAAAVERHGLVPSAEAAVAAALRSRSPARLLD